MFSELAAGIDWWKPACTVVCLALLWSWESWHPFFRRGCGRVRHAAHNLAIALFNTGVLALLFGTTTVIVAEWAERRSLGLLHQVELPAMLRLLVAVLLLDVWLYVWHRANHRLPLLWRFHRMHHADKDLDVTAATRFHLGEHVGSSVLRLGLIPLAGFEVFQLVIYDTLVIAITMFHHANISIGRWDRPLQWLIVTPFMHKVHHSRWQPETDSNYSTLFSFWDRAFRSLRTRSDYTTLELGLDEFDDPRWQTFGGMLQTPFVDVSGSFPTRSPTAGPSGR